MTDTISATFPNLKELTRKLNEAGAASQSVFRQAAEAGAQVIQKTAVSRAPGPYIGIDIQVESSTRVVASIGPTNEKWYYRYFETGTKSHSAKGTRSQKDFNRYLRKSGRAKLVTKPKMKWYQGGTAIYARKVRGIAAKPFMRPAMEATSAIEAAVGEVFWQAITEKTG